MFLKVEIVLVSWWEEIEKSQFISTQLSNAVVCTQLIGFKYCYLTLIILFNINHLFAHSEVVSSVAI